MLIVVVVKRGREGKKGAEGIQRTKSAKRKCRLRAEVSF